LSRYDAAERINRRDLAVESQIVGAYELGALLGSGTVGDVYRARHRDTGSPAVVKFLQARTAREPEVQRRFVREVSIAQKLDHPNIVRHYDCGLHEDQIYFAMELVDSGTLKDVLIRRGTLPWREVAECAIQICSALAYAHKRGVIHRDLKPANLFLSGDGRVKVGDFGLARDLNNSRLTLEGQTVGTCRYMPPEQITGDAELTGAVDLYALGCIMHQALVGRPPFDGDTIIDIFEAHLYSDPVPLTQVVSDCPPHLSELVYRLLAKDPAYRPASATEVQTALDGILHDGRIPLAAAPPTEAPHNHSDPAPSLVSRLYTTNASIAPLKRNLWLIALICGTVVMAIAIAITAVLLRF
jgi:serine/threonine protein kinase